MTKATVVFASFVFGVTLSGHLVACDDGGTCPPLPDLREGDFHLGENLELIEVYGFPDNPFLLQGWAVIEDSDLRILYSFEGQEGRVTYSIDPIE